MKLENWGLTDYGPSVERQLAAVEDVAAGGIERLVLCTHPPVVTLGRATVADDFDGWTGATHESSRGGRATYHGPNQAVIYPILDLRKPHANFGARDIHAYLRALEAAVVGGLGELGLRGAEARTTEAGGISLTGVWIGERKIASIGIAVRKWVTYHGVAINLTEDANAFRGIRPCGFSADVMTTVERELGHALDGDRARETLARICADHLREGKS